MKENKRKYGFLLHPVSLSSEFSIGDFGNEAYKFIDMLHAEHIRYWQILPLNHTGFDNSPYSSISAFAGNPIMISVSQALMYFSEYIDVSGVTKEYILVLEAWKKTPKIDYQKSYSAKARLLKILFNSLNGIYKDSKTYNDFVLGNSYWIEPFAAYKILKEDNEGKSWIEWRTSDRCFSHELVKSTIYGNQEKFDYIVFKQYLFYMQWTALRKYANKKGIRIIGDIPVYVAMDSSDVWSNKDIFDLSDKSLPNSVAGVPPDYFSKTGQLWGNPLYRWNSNSDKVYLWWQERLNHLSELMDEVRIDHFIGLINYWSIPYGSNTAKKGLWKDGPGVKFIEHVIKHVKIKVLAENLGILTDVVESIRKENDIPGMKVMQFHYIEDLKHMDKSDYLYTGTHDNDTLIGWIKSSIRSNNRQLMDWCKSRNMHTFGESAIFREILKAAVCSGAETLIFPVQDALGLGSYGRMNTPGTRTGNWNWKMSETAISSGKISEFMKLVRSFENSS